MDTKALRQKVLDLAIRGKLVPQDPNDEPASVLLERIRQEKQQMVKEGKLKPKDIKNDSIIFRGEDNLHYEKFADGTVKCIEDEIPFEIPDSWAWSRLSSISSNIFAGGDRPSDYSLTKTDVNKYPIYSNGVKENGLYGYCSNPRVTEPSVTVSARGTIGFSCVRMEPFTPIIRLITITPISGYSVAFLNSIFGRLLETGTGSSIPQLTVPNTVNKLIPVPPTNEQNRIATKIEEYSNYCNYIDTQENEIHEMTKELKSKILDLAIRGKLVPQDPDDEPASFLLERIRAEKEELIKQGKIKRDKNESVIFKGDDNSYYEKIGNSVVCIDDELPYSIPDNWTYIRLRNALEYEQPTAYIVDSTAYSNNYKTPVLTAGKSFIIGYTNETYGIKEELPVIIFDDFTTESKFVDFPFKVKSSAMKILTADERIVSTIYAFYAMQKVECDSENHKRYWISEFSDKIIGLPPLNEQRRIVNLIKQIESLFE